MAKKKKNLREDLKGMKKEELGKELAKLREESRTQMFKREGSKSKNVKEFAGIKKQIARALTEINKDKNKK